MFAQRPAQIAALAPATQAAVARLGYDATPAIAEARIRRMLADEPVVWLSTVRRDGTPSLVPTWFWWDGEAITVFSKPEAAKVANLRANPRLMVALGHPEDDFEVGLLEAEAYVGRDLAAVPAAFFAKYRDRLAEAGLDVRTFLATYTLAIRIVPVRYLGWHGRGAGHARHAISGGAADGWRHARSSGRSLLVRVRRWLARHLRASDPTTSAAAFGGHAPRAADHAPRTADLAVPRLPAWA